jgi:hypothetical protein
MSAAATAAGYLYASGRLRGRNAENGEDKGKSDRRTRVAVLAPEEQAHPEPSQPKKTPKIQYRTRRWKPE